MRLDGRRADELRPFKITPDFIKFAEGSVLFEMGDTRVICTASLESKVPLFLKDTGGGWVTAEYNMLPRATVTRGVRESSAGKVRGRTHEIQRLIGRVLRSVVNLDALGERTIWLDCDVIQADGGTRTAAINGAFLALARALQQFKEKENITQPLLYDFVGAISVGILEGEPVLDLNYPEDSSADTDMNIVMTGSGTLVEVQGSAEKTPFSLTQLHDLLALAQRGIHQIIESQKNLISVTLPF